MQLLIADDNRDSADILAMLCESWGYVPTVAYDGVSALNLLRGPNAPMLCLLDWDMPGFTGIDICSAIRQERDRPYRYLILITGRDEQTALVTGLNAGADEFLLKPVDPDELRVRLATGRRVLTLQSQLLETMEHLKSLAAHDGLTGLWNRSATLEILDREMSRGQRDRDARILSVALADIDNFKAINDSRGHLAGDLVLQQVAQRLTSCLRPYDSVGRYGGEEFLIVLPNCNKAESHVLADRLRRCLRDEAMDATGGSLEVTASFGVANWNGEDGTLALLQQADAALYAAKEEGRDRVVVAASHPKHSFGSVSR